MKINTVNPKISNATGPLVRMARPMEAPERKMARREDGRTGGLEDGRIVLSSLELWNFGTLEPGTWNLELPRNATAR